MQISAAVGNECAGSIRRVQQAFKKTIEQPGKSIYTHMLTFMHLYLFILLPQGAAAGSSPKISSPVKKTSHRRISTI